MTFKRAVLSLCIFFLFNFSTTAAAPGQPGDVALTGPVVAFETALADRIVLVDAITGARRDLRFDNRLHHVWDFSPDGCRVLFTLTEGDEPGRLYSARLDGSDMRDLVTGMEPGYGVFEAQWSPDPANDRIAFTYYSTEDDGDGVPDHRIAWVPSSGGIPQFYSVSGDEHTPRWSPDGRWLLYVAYEQSGDVSPVREADFWIVSADGATKYRLTNYPSGSVHSPRWSPDGDLIGFVYSPSPNADQFWMVGNAPDAVPTQLSYQSVLTLDLTWLPDSTAMLTAARFIGGVETNTLWRIPLVGNADVDSTIFFQSPELIYPYAPRFSADGRWLAARSAYALALVDMNTGQVRVLPESLGNTTPVWTPAAFVGEANCA